MGETFEQDILDLIKEVLFLTIKWNAAKSFKTSIKYLDKFINIENKNDLTFHFIDITDKNGVDIIKDIKREAFPHLIWVHNDLHVLDENKKFDYWKIDGFFGTIGTVLRHCRYDCGNEECIDFDAARDFVDEAENDVDFTRHTQMLAASKEEPSDEDMIDAEI